MLTALQLKNFKSWREADVKLAPITGFFGTNSSGKSSLLQALLLMKQSAENSDQKQVLEFGNDKSLVQLGSFQDVIWQHETHKFFLLGIAWKLSGFLESSKDFSKETKQHFSGIPINKIKFHTEISLNENIVFVDRLEFKPEYNLSLVRNSIGFNIGKSRSIQNTADDIKKLSQRKFYHVNRKDKILEHADESIIIDSDFEFALEQALAKIYYLGPIRAFPQRFHTWSGAAPSTVGRQGENTIATLLASRVNGAKVGDTPLEAYIAQKLEQLGLIHGFRLEELKEGSNIFTVRVRRTPESPEVYLTDVGFGVSQVLPVLVACFSVPEGSTIILEQPELHLHPSVQSGLADVFIDAYKTRGVQIILESHSEHLLRRLQRRMAEEQITPEDVKLYFCSLSNGESKLLPLDLDEYGNIHNYPDGFFGDDFEEIAKMSKAGIERRLKAKTLT